MMLGLSSVDWGVLFAAVMAGALVQGTTGFGYALVAAPVLVLVDRNLVPGVVVAAGLPLAVLAAYRDRAVLDFGLLRWALVGRVPGAVLGSWAVVALGQRELALGFAAALLTGVALSVAGVTVRRTTTTMATAGFLSGLMGTATSVGGPPLALVYQHDTGPELRAAMSGFLMVGSVISLGLLIIVGEFDNRDLARSIALLPGVLAGFAASRWTTGLVDAGRVRPVVLGFATVAALTVAARNL